MITQEQVDKISDAFQSTFAFVRPNILTNCFYESEIEKVALIIHDHILDVKRVRFHVSEELAPNYNVYVMTVECK